MKLKAIASSAAVLAAGLVAVMSAPALAASPDSGLSPNAVICDPTYSYTETHTDIYIGDTGTRTYGKSGGTLSISQSTAVATGSAWQVSGSVDVGTILAKVSASVSNTVSQTSTSTVQTTYTWKVPSTQSTGWLEAGHHGYSVSWKQKYVNQNCGVSYPNSGTNKGNTKNIQYTHS